jgi:ribosomal protein S18 acetylase RimI-like enzyme
MVGPAPIPATIRSFRPEDHASCLSLYREGLMGGTLAANDTGLDMDDVALAYLSKPGSHFWVAQTPTGDVVGMIGVQQDEDGVAEIRRLRVRKDCRRRGIGSGLLETAIGFCRRNLFLKVKLDTYAENETTVQLFEKFQFRHSHARTVGERKLRYFYLDLYLSEPTEKIRKIAR